jgi:trimeric autotransporter adhesin
MKRILFFIIPFFLGVVLSAQTPPSFRYQAVARDNSGNVLNNQTVSFRISILSGSASGTITYRETHTGLSTNAFGLIELEIGKGTPVNGTFSAINWGGNTYFVQVEIDPAGGTSYQTLSTSQLLSVPFALHAKTVETGDNWGSQTVNSNSTLTGNGTISTPLGIADNGVNSAKILDGSVATNDLANNAVTTLKIADGTISPADLANSAVTTDKLGDLAVSAAKIQSSAVTSDKLASNSVTDAKIAAGAVTGAKIAQGGATSGQALKWNGTAWAPGNDDLGGLTLPFEGTALTTLEGSSALKVSNSGTAFGSAAITGHATATSGSTRGVIGQSDSSDGRGVQGYASGKTGRNYGVAGFTDSSDGSAAGVYGGASSTTGATSAVMGWNVSTVGTGVYGYAGTSTGANYGVRGISASTSGTGILGEANAPSGATNGVTGRSSSTSGTGVFGTASATSGNTYGVFGSTISPNGRAVGARSVSSTGTTYGVHSQVLSSAGFSGYFTGGKFYVSGNVGIGTETPEYRLDVYAPTNSNTGIAVFRNFSGQNKIELRQNSNGAGALELNNSGSTTTVLLSGDGTNYINGGSLGIGTTAPTQALHVVGNIRVSAIGSGAYWGPVNRTFDGTFTTSTSDIRLKENVKTLNGGLDKVLQLRGVSFNWKSNPEYGNQIGFIAQEVEKVIPELVFTNEVDGYKGVNYAEVAAVMVEAIKELKAENDQLKAENEKVNTRLEKIEALLNTTVKD